MTLRGIPQIYYGSEIGMTGKKKTEMVTLKEIFLEVGYLIKKMHLIRKKEPQFKNHISTLQKN